MGIWDNVPGDFFNEIKRGMGLDTGSGSGSGTTNSQKTLTGGGSGMPTASPDALAVELARFKLDCDKYWSEKLEAFRVDTTRIKLLEKAKIAGTTILLYEGVKTVYRLYNESRRGKN